MKKPILLTLLGFSSLTMAEQEPIYSVSSSPFFQNQTPSTSKESASEKAAAAKDGQMKGVSEIMIITPESRAKDLLSAFQYLKKMSAASKIGVKLTSGSTITDIIDMDVMPAGTMIIFKINSIKGQQFRIVKIEDIDTLTNG
ncbi:MAG: hypothetical protein AB7N99_01780 [Simkaniaceae bacterium]|jgi:hypothetical protein